MYSSVFWVVHGLPTTVVKTYLDAGGAVTATLPSSTLLVNTWTSRLLTVEPRRTHACMCVWIGSLTIHCMLSLLLSVCPCMLPYNCEKFTVCFCHLPHYQQQWRHCDAHGSPVLQNIMVTWSAYPLHIWEVLCPETSFHEWYFTFPHSFHAFTMGSKLGHDYFLPHLLRSVIHWSLYSLTLKNFEITESII